MSHPILLYQVALRRHEELVAEAERERAYRAVRRAAKAGRRARRQRAGGPALPSQANGPSATAEPCVVRQEPS